MLEDHQLRVINEKEELDDRLEKLCLFCYGRTFQTLPLMERERLNQQRHLMMNYSAILGARIAAFSTTK